MVCEWGMSDELGPLTYGKKEEQIFLGREIAQHRDFSEETARQIDVAVKQIIVDAQAKVISLLTENRDILDRVAAELLEKETIVLDDIEIIMEELHPEKYKRQPKKEPQPLPKEAVKETKKEASEAAAEKSAEEATPESELKDKVDLSSQEDPQPEDEPPADNKKGDQRPAEDAS
jgi:cell division protease FtsH